MHVRTIVGLALLLTFAFSVLALTDQSGSFVFDVYVSVAHVQSAAEQIVRDYTNLVSGILGNELNYVPSVVIMNTPNLAYFDSRTGEIVLAHWPTLEGPHRDFFLYLAGTEERAGQLFAGLFNWFLVAHELTHWYQREMMLELDRYASESMANDFAVAFATRAEQGEDRLLFLEVLIEEALTCLSDPTPAGADRAAFFNASYIELARDPSRYGYYQFLFILDAIARRADLDFDALVSAHR